MIQKLIQVKIKTLILPFLNIYLLQTNYFDLFDNAKYVKLSKHFILTSFVN